MKVHKIGQLCVLRKKKVPNLTNHKAACYQESNTKHEAPTETDTEVRHSSIAAYQFI